MGRRKDAVSKPEPELIEDSIEHYNEGILKRKFIELYYQRQTHQTPAHLMEMINAPPRMLTDWLQDKSFIEELEKIDFERVWHAKEQVHRKLPKVIKAMIEVASDPHTRNGVRSGEILLKVASLLKDRGGSGVYKGDTNIVNNQNKILVMPTAELQEQREQLLKLISEFDDTGVEGQAGEGTRSDPARTDSA